MFDLKDKSSAHGAYGKSGAVYYDEKGLKLFCNGKLADIAPTILADNGHRKPKAMTGASLIENNVLESRAEIAHNAVMDSAKMKKKRGLFRIG